MSSPPPIIRKLRTTKTKNEGKHGRLNFVSKGPDVRRLFSLRKTVENLKGTHAKEKIVV
jgi:hypothetical protein